MKRIAIVVTVALLLLPLGACSPGKKGYADALDADREAREKMINAQGLMRDVAAIREIAGDEPTKGETAAIESKRSEAVDAFGVALEGWDEAVEIYEQLIADYPDEPVYLNNLANLIYNKAHNGFEADLDRARELLGKALQMADREIFRRNLELIDELGTDVDTMKLVEENREIVTELNRLSAAKD